jgi:hypothetical protein
MLYTLKKPAPGRPVKTPGEKIEKEKFVLYLS